MSSGSAEAGDPWPLRLFGWVVAAPCRADVLGDLLEEYGDPRGRGARAAVRLLAAVVRAGLASRWQALMEVREARSSRRRGRMKTASRRASMRDTVSQDVRAAWASVRRSPGFTAAVVATLGLGTGIVLSIFALISAVLLDPLPYGSAGRLMHVQGGADGRYAVSMPLHARVVAQAPSVEESSAWQGWSAVVGDPERGIERRSGASVSWSYFDVLGVRPAAGRLFVPEDGRPGHEPVIVLSHEFWRDSFQRRPPGSEVVLDGERYTVVGVAPEDFVDPVSAYVLGSSQPVAFWRADPPVFFDAAEQPGWTAFWSLARVRPGVSAAQLRTDVARALSEAYPEWEDDGSWLRVSSFRDMATAHLRPTLAALFGAAFLVLLIACANVANLLLSRSTVRYRDMVVRASLGASRSRLIRQLFTENLLLAAMAAALGVALTVLALPLLADLLEGHLRPGQIPTLDWKVTAFAALMVLATSLIFGLVPALRATELRLGEVLRAARGPDQSGGATRTALVAVEVALGVIVLVTAGLLGRTLLTLSSTDTGLDVDSAVVMYVSLPEEFIAGADEQNATVAALEQELARIAGVTRVGLITDLPMSGAVNSTGIARPDGAASDATRDQVLVRAVTPGYFEAMGVPLLRGRSIATSDAAGTVPVALVNRSYAGLLPDGALGRTVTVRGVPRQIVGIVEDVVEFRLRDGTGDPVLYTPYPQEDQSWMRTGFHIVLRTSASAAALEEPVRTAVRRVSPAILLSRRLEPMGEYLSADIAAYRFRALLLSLFAAAALLLAAAGIAAVTAYSVSRRIPEIGIRMALGATTSGVVAGVVARSGRAVAFGIAAGLAGALVTGRALSHLLFGVHPADPVAYVTACAALSAVALLAAWIPARRAARVHPATALRAD